MDVGIARLWWVQAAKAKQNDKGLHLMNRWQYILAAIGAIAILGITNKDLIMDTWDRFTNRRIRNLHPIIRDKVSGAINRLDRMGIKVRITKDGHFRSFELQDELYAIGRTKDLHLPKVTNARAGESWHNYALAVDVVEIKNGKALWSNPRWEIIAREFEREGFEWGGRWTRKDRPHFQFRNGLSISQAKNIYLNGQRDARGFILV
ncbi:M15 family metallopeptidase [Sungkyunkwania multivorans]|uniref:M15 family metallopeptidase n=1 Tax=Sungkyunkwania multivorans TaxID=1173618 RepID=A0ABW3CXH4_9FLAO